MHKRILTLVCALFLCLELSASQVIKSENINDFESIELKGNLSVEITKASKNSIEIELIDGDISQLRWKVEQGVLSVSLKNSSANNSARAIVKINYHSINKIDANGCSLSNIGVITSDVFDIIAHSGAIISLQAQTLDTKIEASENSVIQMQGTSRYLTIIASEKSKIDTRSLSAVSVEVETSSMAEAYILAGQRLVAKAKTGSSVHYLGEPSILRAMTPKILKLGANINTLQ